MSGRVLLVFRDPDRLPAYVAACEQTGIEADARLPGEARLEADTQGLLLTGGTDVGPDRYGQEPHPETDAPDAERDVIETRLLERALSLDLPVFCICRGMQMLNVALGGTLAQHIADVPRHQVRPADRGAPAHLVTVEPGTLLFRATGQTTLAVNSRHHQAIDRLAPGLRVAARDNEDGTIEAVEHPGKRFLLAVQWHPEDQVGSCLPNRRIFEAFRAAVG